MKRIMKKKKKRNNREKNKYKVIYNQSHKVYSIA